MSAGSPGVQKSRSPGVRGSRGPGGSRARWCAARQSRAAGNVPRRPFFCAVTFMPFRLGMLALVIGAALVAGGCLKKDVVSTWYVEEDRRVVCFEWTWSIEADTKVDEDLIDDDLTALFEASTIRVALARPGSCRPRAGICLRTGGSTRFPSPICWKITERRPAKRRPSCCGGRHAESCLAPIATCCDICEDRGNPGRATLGRARAI